MSAIGLPEVNRDFSLNAIEKTTNAPIADVCHVIGYRAAQWRLSKQHINVGRGTINATMNEIDIGLS